MDTSNTRSLSVDMKRQLNSADENQQCNKQIVINNQDEQHNIEQREQEQQQTLIITEDKPQNTEHAEDMEDTENRITVWAGGTTFTINKNILIDKSLYFRAMFGGAFKEKHQQEIHIELICSEAMEFIMDYLKKDKITEHYEILIEENMTLTVKYYNAALYFQIPHLPTDIESVLVANLSIHNWYDHWKFADEMNIVNLKHKCMCFAVYKFNEIRNHIEYIDCIKHLHWYLSHKYLNANSEYDIFETGCRWLKIYNNENNLFVVLSCLDYTKVREPILCQILDHELVKSNPVAVEVLKRILRQTENIFDMTAKYADEAQDIVNEFTMNASKRYKPETPCIAGKIKNESHLFAVNMEEKKLTKYLKLAGDNWWGYNVVKWDDFNIIIACGEIGKGRSVWNKDIIKYNILTDKWEVLNKIPNKSRRHAGAVVKDNYLYLIAGVGPFRQTISSVVKYDLLNDEWIKLPDLPETCQMPVAVFDNDDLYVAAEHLYMLNESKIDWINMGKLKLRHTSTFVLANCLYFTTNWSKFITQYNKKHCCYVFAVCENRFKSCVRNISSACNSGNIVYVFTENECEFEGNNSVVSVEKCIYNESDNSIFSLFEWPCDDKNFVANRSGCFTFVDINIKDECISKAGHKWL